MICRKKSVWTCFIAHITKNTLCLEIYTCTKNNCFSKIMENTDNLLVRQAEVSEIIVEDGIIKGVKTVSGASYFSHSVTVIRLVSLGTK